MSIELSPEFRDMLDRSKIDPVVRIAEALERSADAAIATRRLEFERDMRKERTKAHIERCHGYAGTCFTFASFAAVWTVYCLMPVSAELLDQSNRDMGIGVGIGAVLLGILYGVNSIMRAANLRG